MFTGKKYYFKPPTNPETISLIKNNGGEVVDHENSSEDVISNLDNQYFNACILNDSLIDPSLYHLITATNKRKREDNDDNEETEKKKSSVDKVTLDSIREKQIDGILPSRKHLPFFGIETLGITMMHNTHKLNNEQLVPREQSTILAFSGTPGIGKTRCALEGFSALSKCSLKFKQSLDPCYFFAIAFNNGMSILPQDKLLENETKVQVLLLERLKKLYGIYYEQHFGELDSNTLQDPVQFFKQLLKKHSNSSSIIYFVLDEYQELLDVKIKNSERTGLDVMCYYLGTLISTLASAKCHFIPVLSGLDQLSLAKSLRISTYPCTFLATTKPVIYYWDYNLLFHQFSNDYPENAKFLNIFNNDWLKNMELAKVLHQIAGLPRLVGEMFVSMAKKTILHTEKPWNLVTNIFNSTFGNPAFSELDCKICNFLLAYALTETKIDRDAKFHSTTDTNYIQYYEKMSKCRLKYNSDGGSIVVALPHWKVIQNYGAGNFALRNFCKQLKSSIDESFFKLHDRKFEQFNATHFVALIQSYLLLNDNDTSNISSKEVSLKSLFKGGVFSSNLNHDIILKLVPLEYLEADTTDQPFEKHLHFKTKAFNRKASFKTVSEQTVQLFFKDRGIAKGGEKYDDLPFITWSDISLILEGLPESNNSELNIAVVCTTKYFSTVVLKNVKKSQKNIILIGNPGIYSQIDRDLFGIQHFYGTDLFDLLYNIFVPKVIFIKQYVTDDLILFLFRPLNSKQCLENIKKAIPISNNLLELIKNSNMEGKSDEITKILTDNKEQCDDKILIDFSVESEETN